MSRTMVDEPRGLVCHTANLKKEKEKKREVVKGIIQGSEFNPELAKHAQRAAAHRCFKLQSSDSWPQVELREGGGGHQWLCFQSP